LTLLTYNPVSAGCTCPLSVTAGAVTFSPPAQPICFHLRPLLRVGIGLTLWTSVCGHPWGNLDTPQTGGAQGLFPPCQLNHARHRAQLLCLRRWLEIFASVIGEADCPHRLQSSLHSSGCLPLCSPCSPYS
jgi:hypothetical protein